MNRLVFLQIAVAGTLVGAVAAARSEGSRPVAANIEGAKAPMSSPAADKAAPPAVPAAAAVAVAAPESRSELRQPARPERLMGDGELRKILDLGRVTRKNGRYEARLADGRRAILTLDPRLQAAAEDVLEQAKAPMGAVVVMAVDGRVLALAGRRQSKPAPELATTVWAPAASIFKLVTAAALIDAGVAPDGKVCYHGGIRSVLASNLKDDAMRDQLCHDLAYGVAKSQNAIIAKLAHRHLEPKKLRAAVKALGFEDTPDFALAVEPGRADIPAGELDFARVAAGFWQTELSPMGGALIGSTVATGGKRVTPRIVDSVVDGKVSIPVEPVRAERVLAERVAREVAQMMVGTTETGTAYMGFHDAKGRKYLPKVQVAGKTGTLTRQSPDYLQYSWFVGFAPADSPQVVVTVLLGNPERWHLKAHTAARMLLQKFF